MRSKPLNVLLIAGRKGVGKDTAADMLGKLYGAPKLALADEFKQFAQQAFGLHAAYLWGPSALRETVLTASAADAAWEQARAFVTGDRAFRWVLGLASTVLERPASFPEALRTADSAHEALVHWIDGLAPERHRLTARRVLQTLGTEWGRRTLGDDVWLKVGLAKALGLLFDSGASFVTITDGRFPNEVEGVRAAGGKVLHLFDPAAQVPTDGHESERALDNMPHGSFDAGIPNRKDLGLARFERDVHLIAEKLFPAAQPKEVAR